MVSETYFYTLPKYCQADICRSRNLPFPSVANGKRVKSGVAVQTTVWESDSESN